jgi:competence protein ComK
MQVMNSYIIKPTTVLITGEYNQFGKLCTRVLEEDISFLVDKSPKEVIDDSMQYIGYDLRGAIKSTQTILGPTKMCPFMVNLPLGLCMFPDKAINKHDCIFFNFTHVKKPEPYGRKTKVNLSFGHSITVDSRISSFNTKIDQASRLCRITSEHYNNPITFYVEPQSKFQIIKEPNGQYNFKSLEKQEE